MARYMDTDKLIRHLKDEIDGCKIPEGSRANCKGIAYGTELGLKMAISYANTLPAAEVEEVRYARWHTLADYKYRRIVECTHCNEYFEFSKKMGTQIDLLPRCPKCGAKMLGIEQRIAEIEEEIFGREK